MDKVLEEYLKDFQSFSSWQKKNPSESLGNFYFDIHDEIHGAFSLEYFYLKKTQ